MSQHPADHRRMGIYSHLTTEQLTTRRDSYLAALDARLTGPTQASSSAEGAGARSVQFNADTTQLRQAIDAINVELLRRAGVQPRRPIYLV
ncbi:hypothetical protein AX13_04915 [Comamonas aquatica DA1877]|uniref:Uncharacterized protein n=1 Tax=Comamonas aquatica DA1877 TaxID=1457173 RepID=A0A014NJ44_9BURK|nr:hypothetical protein [Comamonas aquatica]EXU79453.1 hypothetical protein AX13_04915 [Comamonas aquatica DA1877]